jgi:tetratricopeptide (TPR) repeat protein
MKVAGLLFFVSLFLAASCGLGPDLSKDRVERSPTPTPFVPEKPIEEYMRDGSAAYSARDYQAAIPPYKRALEIEQRSPKLDKKLWYVLVDNLAMSYGMTGDSKNARVVLAYGLSKDYNYPMFHYILAVTYGEDGDESNSLLHLRRAFEFRANMIEGETFPDPMTDSSFESFRDSDTFKKAVADMKKNQPRPREKTAANR